MSANFGDPLFGEGGFGESPSPIIPERVPLRLELDGVDITGQLWHNHLTGTLSQDGNTAEIWLDYTDFTSEDLPPVDSRFTIILSTGRELVFQCQNVGEVPLERYQAIDRPVWVHQFNCVDPLTILNDQLLPDNLRSMVNTTTGAVLAAVIQVMDPTLVVNLAPGFQIPAVNFSDFSTFGDLRKSDITRSGQYVVRMEDGLNVRGAIETDFPSQSDWKIDQDDFRYTPTRFKISPGANKVTSVKVTPSGDIPLYRAVKVAELDGRAMSGVTLEGKIFGIDQSEVFKLTSGEDISDPKLWEQTGDIGMDGSAILLNGSLVNLEARPFVFPFMISWVLIPDEGVDYQVGFQDGNGNWLWSVTSGDYALEESSGDDEHTYEIYTLPYGSSSLEVWGYHLHQNFNVDPLAQISTVLSVDYANNIVVLASAWNIDNNYIRFVSVDDGTERGRTRIFHRNGTTLECDVLPPGIKANDPVTRGESADSVITIIKIKDVQAPGPYGLPAVLGSGVHLRTFSIQRTGQIEGYLLSEHDSMPDQVYPRALKLDVDSTEFSDGTVSGSGSGASVALNVKYDADRDFIMAFNYVIGGKRDFKSTCGSGGGGLVVPVTEQDPIKLQAIADLICSIASRNWPRVTSDMHSPMIEGFPTPFDPLPLNLDPHYRNEAASVPLLSSKFTHVGATSGSDISDEDVLLFEMEAGEKTPSERAIEESLRGTVLAKYPIQVATIGGARVTAVSWNDVTLRATVTGVSAVYGPRGQLLDLAGGVNPAQEAGIADPNAGPISLRCHADGGNFVRDLIIFELIYPPKPVIQESVTCHYNALTNLITYHINRPSGALAFDIQRKLDPDGDGTYEYTNIARQISTEIPLPYEPNSRSVKVRSIGLCDKVSGDYVELDCDLPTLPALTLFEVAKVKPGGVINLRISPPPTGADITGRAKMCRVFIKRLEVDDPPVTQRSDYLSDSSIDYIVDVPIVSKTATWRAQVTFEDTDANDVVWIAAAWLDGFGEEGNMTAPFDATNPPVTIGLLSLAHFFQTSPQNQGGTIEDDDAETTQVEFSGVFRYELGQNNSLIRLKMEESLPDPAHGYATGVWPAAGGVFHQEVNVGDDDIDNGFVLISFKQYFRWSKKKHRTYRPTKVVVEGPKIRERGQNNDQVTRETVYIIGYDGANGETPPALVPYVVDAVFDKSLFEFHVGVAGFANTEQTVSQGTIAQLNPGFEYDWTRLELVEIRRYLVLIHTSPFGTKGPGQDATIAVDLNAVQGSGQVAVYNAANTVKNVTVQALDVGDVGKHIFGLGNVIGSITIQSGVTYYVSVIAENFLGQWSVDFSTVLNTTSGAPVVFGDNGPPGPVLNLNWVWKEAIGYKIGFDQPTVNATSIQYFWAVVYDDVYPGGTRYMDPATGLVMAPGTTETQARFQIPGPHVFVRVRRATMDSQFVSDGVRVKVWAVNYVATILTEANSIDRIVSSRLIPGSDAGGPAVDAGAPDIPTGLVRFKNGTLLSRLKPGTNNYETVIQYEHTFFYPAGATGANGSRRTFFDPDTGLDTGVWETSVSTTATFGLAGNSGFYGSNRLRGAVTKATLPTGAITGGFDMTARAWNKTQGSTGPVATTNPATDAAFATSTRLGTYSLNAGDGDFANDRDQANWINSASAATAAQAGLGLISTKKSLWGAWLAATHLISSPDDTAHPAKYGYKLRAGDDSNNWFDRVNPGTSITVDANAEFFTTALETVVASMKSDMASVFRTNGFKLAVRAYNYIAGVLTAGPWTAYTLASVASDDALAPDTVVSSSLTTPILTGQPNILKTQGMHADANANQWLSTDVVYKVVDDAGVLVNYINAATNTATASEATAKINIKSGHHNLPITRAQLITAFGGPTNRNVRVYYYVNNPIGSSLKSTDSLSLPFSSIVTDLAAQDSAVPSSLNTPTIVPRKEGIRVKNIQATANNNSMLYCELVVKVVNSGGTLIGYLDPASLTGAGVAANEAAAKIQISDVDDYLYKVRKDDLLAVWTGLGGTHLRAYYYATNKIGTNATPSSDSASVAISSLGTDAVAGDVAVPSGLSAPVSDWTAAGRLRIRGMVATTDIHTEKKKYLVIYDGTNNSSTKFLDIVNRTTIIGVANEASARFEFKAESHKTLTDIKKKIYKNVFGASGTFYVYWYDENDLGVSSKSADSNSNSVSAMNETLSDDRDSVNVIDIGVTLFTAQNLLLNGDALYDDGAAHLNAFTKGNLGAGTTAITTTTTDDIYWDQPNHSVVWINATSSFYQNLKKRLTRGDYFALTFLAKTNGSFGAGTLNFAITNGDDTIAIVAGAAINLADLTSSYQLFGMVLQTDGSSDFSANKFFRLSVSGATLSSTNNIIMDKLMKIRGKQGVAYASRAAAYEGSGGAAMPGFVGAPGNAENINVTPNSVAVPDLGSPSGGLQGGWVGPGVGGRIIPGTL